MTMSLKDYNQYTVGDLIRDFCRRSRGPLFVEEMRIAQAWPAVAGSYITSHTLDVVMRGNCLFVRLDSDSLRFELFNRRTRLVNELNKYASSTILKYIIFK